MLTFILLRVHHLSALSPGRALKSCHPRCRDHGVPSTQISFQNPSPSKAQGFLGEKPDLSSEAAEVLDESGLWCCIRQEGSTV